MLYVRLILILISLFFASAAYSSESETASEAFAKCNNYSHSSYYAVCELRMNLSSTSPYYHAYIRTLYRKTDGSNAGGASYHWFKGTRDCPFPGQWTQLADGSVTCEEPIPECPVDTYYDPGSGECTEPPEICFYDVVSGQQICEELWPDEAPDGCVMNDGVMLCLPDVNEEYPEPQDPNLECIVVDGVYTCNQPDEICGVKNGTYQCVHPEQEGCGYFNGERICFDPQGNPVPPDSPDHPDNGGNLDGDPNNDVTDNRTPEEGGNPDKQPIDTTGQGDGATEGTAKEQLKALRQLRDEAVNQNKANTGNGAALEQGISSGIASAGDAATAQLDQHIDGVNSGAPMSKDDLSGVEAKISNLFGVSTQCVDIVFGTDDLYYTITCQQMDKIRDFLGFILYGFTLIRLFQILLRPAAQGTP